MSEHDRHAVLLDRLRLERTIAAKPETRLKRRWLVAGGALVLAGAAWWLLPWHGTPLRVHAVTALPASVGAGSLLDASGYVIARRQATLSAKILGKLVDVDVEEGERVAQGQIVARLDDSNTLAALKQSQAQAIVAKAALDQEKTAYDDAVPNYRRYRALFVEGAISAEALDAQKALYDAAAASLSVAAGNLDAAKAAVGVAQANEDDTIVRAPFAGVVTDKAAQPGEIVAPAAAGGGFTRTGIATVVDMDSLEVQVDVSENYIDRVRPGQKAAIRLNAYPDWEIPASVIAIIPTADETKGSVKVRVEIGMKDRRILPQMGARVAFMAAASAPSRSVLVPLAAVKQRDAGASLFVVEDDGHVSERPVHLGAIRGKLVTITSGVAAGERIALGDLATLRDGSKVEIGGGR